LDVANAGSDNANMATASINAKRTILFMWSLLYWRARIIAGRVSPRDGATDRPLRWQTPQVPKWVGCRRRRRDDAFQTRGNSFDRIYWRSAAAVRCERTAVSQNQPLSEESAKFRTLPETVLLGPFRARLRCWRDATGCDVAYALRTAMPVWASTSSKTLGLAQTS
jgi:hypothetical protein